MILNPFTEPVYIRLIEIDNNFATNIFNKMLFDNFYGWSETSLVFLKKEDEENDDNVNSVLTFDVNLIIKLLEQLSAFNRYEDSINFYNANKNIENIINTYLNNLQIVDSKNFFEIKKAVNKIKNINLYANGDNSKQYLNIKKEVINILEKINNESFNSSTKLNNSINNTRLFSYNTKVLDYKNLAIKNYLQANDTKVLNYYVNDLNYKLKTQFLYNENNELRLENHNGIFNFKKDATQKNIFANDIIRKIYFQKLKFTYNNEKESINNIYNRNISRKKSYKDREINNKNIFNYSKNTEEYFVLNENNLNENTSLINNIQLKQLIINTKFKKNEIEFYNEKTSEILNNIELKELINKDSFNSTYKMINSNLDISENNIINYKYLNQEFKSISKKYDNLIENTEIANEMEVSTVINKNYILNYMNLFNEMFLYNGYNLKTFKNNTITLLNNDLISDNIMNKNILYKNLFSNMKVQDINSKIILKINKNTEENIFEKELLNYINNYKKLLFQDVRELKEIIKEKFVIHHEEVTNKSVNSIKTKFNKEIIKKDTIEIYYDKTNKYLSKINEKKFIAVELLDNIQDIHIINEFKNKKNKILNIVIKENEIIEKIINNKFTLNELQYEIKEFKKEFIENIILKNINSNLITNKNEILQQDKIYNELENNDKYYIKYKETINKNKNILYSKLLNKITNEDFKQYFKITNLTYLKDISNLEDIEIFKNNISNLPQGIKNIIKNIFLSNKYENNENSNESKIALNKVLTKKLGLDVENTLKKLKVINKSKNLINKNIYESLSGNFTNEYILKRFEKNNIIPKTLLNNSLMVQRIIDKEILLNNLTKHIRFDEIDSTRMLKLKKENIFEKELFINIEKYKDLLYKDIKHLQQIIKYKFEVTNKENNAAIKSHNELFNKEILNENNSYNTSVSLKNVSKETFNYKNILNKIENIKDYDVINEINNKQRKLLNIIFKENELSKKIINNEITLTQLKDELKDVEDNFIKEILLKTVNHKVSKNKLIKHNEENEHNISELEKINNNSFIKSKKNILTNNKIEDLELVRNISENDIEFLKDIKLSYSKEISVSRESRKLEVVTNDLETVINLKNVVNKIGKNILINEDFKNNLITSLNKETNKKINIKNILNETTQVRNLKSFMNLINNESFIVNERFIKEIKSLKIKDINYSFKFKNEINNISSTHSFAKHFLSKRFEKQNISSLKEILINSTINKNVEFMQYENKNLEQQYSQDKLNYFNKNIEHAYDENINMNYKREKRYSSNQSKEDLEISKKYVDEEKLNKILNESIENILEKKINLKTSNNDENEKINYISKKVLSKIKKDLDYEKRKRGLF